MIWNSSNKEWGFGNNRQTHKRQEERRGSPTGLRGSGSIPWLPQATWLRTSRNLASELPLVPTQVWGQIVPFGNLPGRRRVTPELEFDEATRDSQVAKYWTDVLDVQSNFLFRLESTQTRWKLHHLCYNLSSDIAQEPKQTRARKEEQDKIVLCEGRGLKIIYPF